MLLVHAGRVVNVSVDLSHVVEVPVGHLLAVCNLLVLVEQVVQVELAFQVLESPECKALAWSI